jgi:solute:Na+ symporter, SSS family
MMHPLDYFVLIGFMAWMLAIGWIFSRQVKDASDMFAAGGQSPWWLSGLSAFMTIFSAGTFVVWGGLAYRLGMVAVSILMVIGLSAILVGFTVAGRWRRMGIETPAEFLRIRFSEPVVQAYIWLGMIYRGISVGIGLYALAVMLAVLVPLPEGAPFRDAATGNLSVNWSILLWGAVVIFYTMTGGLWAVLMTDVIQCLVLCLVVLVAVPLSISAAGGFGALWREAPPGFFSPVAEDYTYTFLFVWLGLGFFRYAGDWAYVQRYICVPRPADARKVAYLMGGLYLISPILWMLPAMAYRMLDPKADPEQAYMLICCRVLPAGMLGAMIAAMFSATASTVSAMLNVFAATFTCDFYKPLIAPDASEKHLVRVGRLATLGYGILTVAIAIAVPYVGGAETLVITLLTALMGPMLLPAVWGLYSRHIGPRAVWATLLICTPAAVLLKCLPACESPGWASATVRWIHASPRAVDGILGLFLPLAIMLIAEIAARRRGIHPGWQRMEAAFARYAERPPARVASRLPARVIAFSLFVLCTLMTVVTIGAAEQRATLAVFSVLLLVATVAMTWVAFRPE